MIKVAFYCTKDHPKYKDALVIAEYIGADLIDLLEPLNFLDNYECVMAWYNSHHIHNNREIYYLSILDKNNNYKKFLYIDYINHCIAGKKPFNFGYNDSLPKAMGLAKLKNQQVHILDGTAGFTIDSFAVLRINNNIKITLIEQSPILYCLIKDALVRLQESLREEDKQLASRVLLVNANLIDYISENLNMQFDIIYLDPMFDKQGSKSRPKKNMQLLQDICTNPVTVDELLSCTLEYIYKLKHDKGQVTKVILKRSNSQAKLLANQLNYSVETKQIRYDVYI